MSYRTRFKTVADTIEEEARKLQANEETAMVYQQFIETFEEPTKVHKTWVKGGTVNPGSSTHNIDGAGSLYQPYLMRSAAASGVGGGSAGPPVGEKSSSERMREKFQSEINEKPRSVGKSKEQSKKKKSNLETFSEELKQIQQEREMRMMKRSCSSSSSSSTGVGTGIGTTGAISATSGTSTGTKFTREPIESSKTVGLDDQRKSRFDLNSKCPPGSSHLTGAGGSSFISLTSPFDLDFPYDAETDRTTTNLFLGNLNPELTEQQLCELFGRFGPLASVKIMWPRSEEEKARGRNCGFVAFMNRSDGERALEKLRGNEIFGYEMKLGWGKTVLIPPHPVYVSPALQELIKPPPPSGLPFNAQPRDWLLPPRQRRLLQRQREQEGSQQQQQHLKPSGAGTDARLDQRMVFDMFSMSEYELAELLRQCVVKVTIPTDRPLLQLINRTVEFVVREGVEFEAFIMNKEMRNPNFKFLFDFQSPEHVYYRWKLYSILHGESVKHWKTDEFLMYVDGPFWRPPPLNPFTSGLPEELIDDDIDFSKLTLENISQSLTSAADLSKESNHHHNQSGDVCMENPYNSGTAATAAAIGGGGGGLLDSSHGGGGHHHHHHHQQQPQSQQPHLYKRQLTTHQRERFLQVLTELEPSKGSVGEAMVWCLEHADSAEDVLDLIVKQIEKMTSTTISSSIDIVGGESGVTTNNGSNGLNQIVALLFLVSDILHNSCAKVRNASFYRKYIENSLPQLMTFFNQYYLSLTSKVKSEQLKHKVLSCFRAWGDWYVYPFEFLQRLRNQFLGIEESSTNEVEKVDRKVAEENLIGGCQPLVDYDGDPLDVDGVPLENNSTTATTSNTIQSNVGIAGNGAVLPVASVSSSANEMLDMFANPSSPEQKSSSCLGTIGIPGAGGRAATLFVPSKWETVDPADEESDMVQSRWQLMEMQSEDKKSSDNDDPDGYPLSDDEGVTRLSHVLVPSSQSHHHRHHRQRHISPKTKHRRQSGGLDSSGHVTSLVSYGAESSDNEDQEDFYGEKKRHIEDEAEERPEDDYYYQQEDGQDDEESKDRRSSRSYKSSSSKRKQERWHYKGYESPDDHRRNRSKSKRQHDPSSTPRDTLKSSSSFSSEKNCDYGEMRSRVIRLDNRDDSSSSDHQLSTSRRLSRDSKRFQPRQHYDMESQIQIDNTQGNRNRKSSGSRSRSRSGRKSHKKKSTKH